MTESLPIGKNNSKTVRSATVYDEITTYVDNQTGEVISQSKKSITKRKENNEFTMVFIQGLSRLTKSDLTQAQCKVLFELMKYSVNNTNMLYVNKATKELIAEEGGIGYRTVENCISDLVKKEVILRVKRSYLLNPLIFGRGGLENVKKLTQSLEIEYDFENGTATEKLTTKGLYKEIDNTNINNSEVVEANENVYGDNGEIVEQEVVIKEKEPIQIENKNNETHEDKDTGSLFENHEATKVITLDHPGRKKLANLIGESAVSNMTDDAVEKALNKMRESLGF